MELNIDTGDKDKNEQFFDQLYRQKDGIEQEMGIVLSWERMDNARLCRIATYREGSIEAEGQELEELQDWAVDKLIRFRDIFGNRIKAL